MQATHPLAGYDGRIVHTVIDVVIDVTDVDESDPTPPPPVTPIPELTLESGSREVAENSPGVTHVGAAVAAQGGDGEPLTYAISGDAAFTIDAATGQISVAEGALLDHESTPSYTVTVSVSDGKDDDGEADPSVDASADFTINVTDVDEPPPTPDAPWVTQVPENPDTELDVTWVAALVSGAPETTGYDVRYRVEGASDWTSHPFDGVIPSTTLTGLEPGTTYEVQVLARNHEGESAWSESGVGVTAETGPDRLNAQREVPENAPAGTPVGDPLTTTDSEGHTIVYTIADAPNQARAHSRHGPLEFSIDSATGQLMVAAGAHLDFETAHRHTFTVIASHAEPGLKGSDDHIINAIISVVIDILDVDETPPASLTLEPASREVVENSPGATPVGAPIAAAGGNDDPLTYAISGSHLFTIDPATGQIRVAADADLDHEAAPSHTVTVSVSDGKDADGNADPSVDASAAVTISVTDLDEPPPQLAAPAVSQSPDDPTSALDVAWSAPDMTGKPPVTSYRIVYRELGGTEWTSLRVGGSETSTTLTGLQAETTYQVFVRARNDEGAGPWSDAGEGSTARRDPSELQDPPRPDPPGPPEDPPTPPEDPPSDDPSGDDNGAPSLQAGSPRQVAENSPAGTAVGAAVAATDPDGDPLTYSMTGSGAFVIDPASGQIRVAPGAALDYETGPRSYTVIVRVSDGKNADGDADAAIDDTVAVTIRVTDVAEPPARPDAPAVTLAPSDQQTSLQVDWTAPANSGPPITDYDVRYRKQGATAWTSHAHSGAATTARLRGLEAGTTYEVQVAARNAEGTSAWSEAGRGATAVGTPPFLLPPSPPNPPPPDDPDDPDDDDDDRNDDDDRDDGDDPDDGDDRNDGDDSNDGDASNDDDASNDGDDSNDGDASNDDDDPDEAAAGGQPGNAAGDAGASQSSTPAGGSTGNPASAVDPASVEPGTAPTVIGAVPASATSVLRESGGQSGEGGGSAWSASGTGSGGGVIEVMVELFEDRVIPRWWILLIVVVVSTLAYRAARSARVRRACLHLITIFGTRTH